MKTRITELFGIEHPIIMSGMSWVSVPKLVAAVSNAGGLGILATGPLDTVQTRESVREIRRLTDKPFGANASLLFPGAKENAQVLLEEKVPVINFALGKGDWICDEAHKYGGKVVATVVNH
ncbi:MAG: nitronate monooxygenase, partial [Thermodesulfobacteriota bacterium]|nr:nitronate monooxygenase [Thermodesulfobacteriota bacterium]